MTASSPTTVKLGDRAVPVVWPNRRDARLHTAAVIISIHTIGVFALGFRVSIPQILSAIVAAAIVDVAVTFRTSGSLVWPASGMLTGSGVALILRLVGMSAGDYWSWQGWYWFALVAVVAISTKFVIRRRGQHVFNPSNVGLVAAFLILGSGLVEPLDFWWAPLGPWMLLAYVVIIGGGVAITRRLRLLEMAAVYWVVLAAGLAVLAWSGHCMTTAWSPTPVCDGRFWTVLVTSPEVLIFLFFMITDPKTIPSGRSARVLFAGTLAAGSVILMAPQTIEFGTKVALLGALTLWSPLRPLFDHVLPAREGAGLRGIVGRLTVARPPAAVFGSGLAIGVAVVAVGAMIMAAGSPARPAEAADVAPPEVDVRIDAGALPEVSIDPSVSGLAIVVDDAFATDLSVTLAENLAIEGEAIREADGGSLWYADAGGRLDVMQAKIDDAITEGVRPVDSYRFETMTLRSGRAETGQSGGSLVLVGTGVIDTVDFDPAGRVMRQSSSPFALDFVMRQVAGERWLIAEVVSTPPGP
jgi:hypothetical protein